MRWGECSDGGIPEDQINGEEGPINDFLNRET